MLFRNFIPVCLLFLAIPALAQEYPPPEEIGDPREMGYGVQRTMRLLATSTPEKRNTVRILFYGQSITEQNWWVHVVNDLRARFPHANLVVSNYAIGGFSSIWLEHTAETDLFPFYPDLLIFHVYGPLDAYARLMRAVRQRTASEILMATDHVTTEAELNESLLPDRMSAAARRNYIGLPFIANSSLAELADIRTPWKKYLRQNGLPPSALLRDHIHLNAHGEFLMAELIKPRLRYNTNFFPDPQDQAVTTYVEGRDFHWANGAAELVFSGNRVDLIASGSGGAVTNYIDGLRPSEIPSLYAFSRTSGAQGTWRPALMGLRWNARLLPEEWTLTILEWNPASRQVTFKLEGSETGPDGKGSSAAPFLSNSGRVLIQPEAWNHSRNTWWLFPPRPGFQIRWRVNTLFQDVFVPPEVPPGVEPAASIARGLPNGRHTLRMEGPAESPIAAIRVYNPAAMRPPLERPRIVKISWTGNEITINVRGTPPYQLQSRPSGSPSDAWVNVGGPATGSELRGRIGGVPLLFRVVMAVAPPEKEAMVGPEMDSLE